MLVEQVAVQVDVGALGFHFIGAKQQGTGAGAREVLHFGAHPVDIGLDLVHRAQAATGVGLVLLRPYTEYLQEYLEKVDELRAGFTPGEVIASESEQKRFIQLFGAILRLRNILTSFDDFAGADVLKVGEFDDYKSTYVDLYQELRRKIGRAHV